jgi:hypothetical protein
MGHGVETMAFQRRGVRAPLVVACCAVWLWLASCGTTTGGIQAGDSQNGKSITLHAGQTLVVTLASTYWSFQGSSDSRVLSPIGAPVTTPASCPPGMGCGTVSQAFRAVGPGTAQITASRVSCGEAIGCTGATGHYQLTVQVV